MDKISIMEASARKWQRIIDGKSSDGGVLDCPPCRIFYMLVCVGCPIAGYSGKKFCQKTPYIAWYHHQVNEHGYIRRKIYCDECIRLATEMRDYMLEIVEHLKAKKASSQDVSTPGGSDTPTR